MMMMMMMMAIFMFFDFHRSAIGMCLTIQPHKRLHGKCLVRVPYERLLAYMEDPLSATTTYF